MKKTTRILKKILRTVQSEFPMLKQTKEVSFLHLRRLLRLPHEKDFYFIKSISDVDERCYVDVGANWGQSVESILLFKPNAQIVAFEPNIMLAERLRYLYRNKPNVRIVGKGLADRSGSFTLFMPSYNGYLYDGLASFSSHEAATWLSPRTIYRFDPKKLTVLKLECYVETLDSQDLKPLFIKIDVQGYECQVLMGAKKTLEKYKPIILIEGFRSNKQTVSLAEELGYEEYHFDGGTCKKGKSRTRNSFLLPSGALT